MKSQLGLDKQSDLLLELFARVGIGTVGHFKVEEVSKVDFLIGAVEQIEGEV